MVNPEPEVLSQDAVRLRELASTLAEKWDMERVV